MTTRTWSTLNRAALAVVVACCLPPYALGEVIFQNFGPNDSHFLGATQVGGPEKVADAMPFSVSGGNFLLDTVELAAVLIRVVPI